MGPREQGGTFGRTQLEEDCNIDYRAIREEVALFARKMLCDGLVTLTAGNISVRIPGEDLVAITPSTRPYETMTAEEITIVDLAGRVVFGEYQPSTETPMHAVILRKRPLVRAVVHTHSPHALAFAVTHQPIPLIRLEGVVTRATSILCAEYAVPSTEELGYKALAALDKQPGSRAVLLANHGVLAIGACLREAYGVAVKVEAQALVYPLALAVGAPIKLTVEQLQEIYDNYVAKLPAVS